jgi:hypothetical protein
MTSPSQPAITTTGLWQRAVPARLLDQVAHASVEVTSLSVHLADIDDVVLALTGQPDRDGTTVP